MPAGQKFSPLLPAGLVALCFLLGVLSRGLNDAFSVFVLPISESFAAPRAAVTGIYAVGMIGMGMAAPVAGILFDRLGPRLMMALALSGMGLGTVAAGWAQSLWHLYLAIGVVGGFACAALGGVYQAGLLGRWFRARLGTAIGAAYSANGVGIMIAAPLAAVLIEAVGWRHAYQWLGGAVLVVVVPLLFLPWRRIEAGDPSLAPIGPAGGAGPSFPQALRRFTFWSLMWAFAWTSVGIYCLTPQLAALLVERGYTPAAAAGAVGVSGLLMPIGMVGFNWFADRGGRLPAVILSYGCTLAGIAALAALAEPGQWLLLAGFVVLFGISMGSRGPMISTLAALAFRGPSLGRIYGTIAMGMGLGGASGAWAGGALHDHFGGYGAVMILAALSLGLGAVPLAIESLRAQRC